MKDLALPLDVTRAGLHAAYAAGLAPEAAMEQVLAAIEAAGDPGIFLHLRPLTELRAEAAALPPFDPVAYPLWGLPFAIKDNIDLSGSPTTAACPEFSHVPQEDAFAVAALRAAGAIPVGKTNLDQFATGLVGVRSPYPVPKNALDPEIVPGGSSSGSAVAVARGLVSFALGTDTAGSGRVPAALNGIVGLKPTLGAISGRGMVPACRTLDTISVFALSVADAWAAFVVAAAADASDPYARPLVLPPLPAAPPARKVGVPTPESRRFFGDAVQAAAFEADLALLTRLGATLVEVDFSPFYQVAELLYDGPWVAERMAAIGAFRAAHPGALHPVTEAVIAKAEGMSAADAFRGLYRLAELRHRLAPVIAGLDMLAVPTIPTFYSCAALEADPIGPNSNLGTYTNFVNLLDLCGLAVPTAARGDGRPGSLTLLGARGRDAQLAAFGALVQAAAGAQAGATGIIITPEQGFAGALPGEMVIAAVGAHMSGLPLNPQLTSRGGRYLETTCTSAAYRLHALAGGPPFRPGLMRVSDGNGAKIALELWALPEDQAGSFLAGIPAPLGLGRVELEDGRQVTGFICEAAGLDGATDITGYGGWRGYLAGRG